MANGGRSAEMQRSRHLPAGLRTGFPEAAAMPERGRRPRLERCVPDSAEHGNPFQAVDLPEFGTAVSWAMCRNSMCPNFGIHYSAPDPVGGVEAPDDERYLIRAEGGGFKLACRLCGDGFTLNSNRAVRALARHFLSQSLPFATCPDPDCVNFGVNAFERAPFERGVREGPYRHGGSGGRLRCRRCRGRASLFTLGTPLALKGRERKHKKQLRNVIRGTLYFRSLWMIQEEYGISRNAYYTLLKRAGARVRDYFAWRNARLLHPTFSRRAEPVRVYTDVLTATLARGGKGRNHVHLSIPVSSVDLPEHRTFHILAAHCGFLPGRLCEDDLDVLLADARRPHAALWDCIAHAGTGGGRESAEEEMAGLPHIVKGGAFTASPYTELAHFLTVRKMLSRFPKVHHHMDAHHSQSAAALTALASDVRAGRCEIVLSQRRRKLAGDRPGERWPGRDKPDRRREWLQERLDGVWRDAATRLGDASGESGDLLSGASGKPGAAEVAARFASARDGANSGEGGWAWIDFPPPGPKFKGGRSLWLTERPGASYEAVGRDLLWASTALPVDSVHSRLRDTVRGLRRPGFRAGAGRSFRRSYRDPETVMAELWLALFRLNFWRRRPPRKRLMKGDGPLPPSAVAMGLAGPNEPRKKRDLADIAWRFRLGTGHAERIAGWLRR